MLICVTLGEFGELSHEGEGWILSCLVLLRHSYLQCSTWLHMSKCLPRKRDAQLLLLEFFLLNHYLLSTIVTEELNCGKP